MNDSNAFETSLPALVRAMAFLALHLSDYKDKSLGEQAQFLGRLGVPRKDIATLLETSEESVRKLISYVEKAKSTRAKKGENRDDKRQANR